MFTVGVSLVGYYVLLGLFTVINWNLPADLMIFFFFLATSVHFLRRLGLWLCDLIMQVIINL